MTIRHMILFRTVCREECNTTRAAQRLHMTQPAVSLAIKELEAYYGVRLFDRIGRRLRITEAGQRFLQYAIHISDLFADLETGMRDWNAKGVLRVGASITIGSQFLPGYVKAFSRRYPEMEIRATVEQSERLEKKLLANELDFALIEGTVHDPHILSTPYRKDHLCVVCSPQKGWRQGQRISREEFLSQKFLLREKGSGTREVFDRVLAQEGMSVTPIWEAMSTTALLNGVMHDLGISVLPYRMVLSAQQRGLVHTVEVEGLRFLRDFYMIFHKDKFFAPPAREFMALCRDFEKDPAAAELP